MDAETEPYTGLQCSLPFIFVFLVTRDRGLGYVLDVNVLKFYQLLFRGWDRRGCSGGNTSGFKGKRETPGTYRSRDNKRYGNGERGGHGTPWGEGRVHQTQVFGENWGRHGRRVGSRGQDHHVVGPRTLGHGLLGSNVVVTIGDEYCQVYGGYGREVRGDQTNGHHCTDVFGRFTNDFGISFTIDAT